MQAKVIEEFDDQLNAEQNEVIRICKHRVESLTGPWKCCDCGARFAILMLPRNRPIPILDEDDLLP